jgi:hypothetical protein
MEWVPAAQCSSSLRMFCAVKTELAGTRVAHCSSLNSAPRQIQQPDSSLYQWENFEQEAHRPLETGSFPLYATIVI